VPKEGQNCSDDQTVSISTKASDAENDPLTYSYTVSGGRIVGNGANVSWDLTGVQPGNYTVTVGANDGCGICGNTKTETITVERCACEERCSTCGSVSVSSSGIVQPGENVTFTANVSGGTGDYNYNWSVSQGDIISGQGTPSITVRTTREMANSNIIGTVNVSENGRANCPACNYSGQDTASVAPLPEPRLIIEQGKAVPDEIKAAVDAFYIELNNNPTASGYIINYGTAKEVALREKQIRAAIAFRKYDISRITFVNGGNLGTGPRSKYWLVPAGANPPQP
jgi:hypothetical protein